MVDTDKICKRISWVSECNMDDETRDDEILEQEGTESAEGFAPSDNADVPEEGHSDYKPVNRFDAAAVHHLL